MHQIRVIKSGNQAILESTESGIILRLALHSDCITRLGNQIARMDNYSKDSLQSIVNETLNPDVIQIVEL